MSGEVARYEVSFTGPLPDSVKVGDVLSFSGRGTVHKLDGDLVEVTELGSDPQFLVGGLTVSLVANRATIDLQR